MAEPEISLPAERPPLMITLSDKREIKMVYGLEMDLRRLLPDPQSAMQAVMADPWTQDYIVRRCLTDSRKMLLTEEELISMDEVELTSEDIEEILGWVTEHILYFFVIRTQKMANLGIRFKASLPQLSTSGSEDSPSTTPSAGPSDV